MGDKQWLGRAQSFGPHVAMAVFARQQITLYELPQKVLQKFLNIGSNSCVIS